MGTELRMFYGLNRLFKFRLGNKKKATEIIINLIMKWNKTLSKEEIEKLK